MVVGLLGLVVACYGGFWGYELDLRQLSIQAAAVSGYDMAWEHKDFKYPSNMAPPLQVGAGWVGAAAACSDTCNWFLDILPDSPSSENDRPL